MQETFEQFVETIRVEVLRRFNETGELLPTWFLQQEDGKILLLTTPYEKNTLQKDIVDFAIREAIAEKNIQRFVYISEVWMANVKDVTSLKNYKGLPPSERPDRKEAVMLIAEDISGKSIMACADIFRNPVTNLGMIAEIKLNMEAVRDREGRFVDMFKRKKPPGSPVS
jgi:hypothetical protein